MVWPVAPPTEERVREWCAASGRFPKICWPRFLRATDVARSRSRGQRGALRVLPRRRCCCCAPPSRRWPIPDFNLFRLQHHYVVRQAGSVRENGPVCDELGIPYRPGCFGRCRRVLRWRSVAQGGWWMRNVGGQVVGESSKRACLVSPGRVTGNRRGGVGRAFTWALTSERRGVVQAPTRSLCTDAPARSTWPTSSRTTAAISWPSSAKSLAWLGTNASSDRTTGRSFHEAIAPPGAALIVSIARRPRRQGKGRCGRAPRPGVGVARAAPTGAAREAVRWTTTVSCTSSIRPSTNLSWCGGSRQPPRTCAAQLGANAWAITCVLTSPSGRCV